MPAIGWVDFSSEHREKIKSVIDLLSVPGVVDELGIGVIRDSFSDSLFPGISTIQTRAKYLVTVPRIFKEYEKLPAGKRRRHKLTDYLNDLENRCMKAMVANHKDDKQDGIIGESFAEKQGEVQRKPSSVYWTGIRQFGLIKTKLSLQQFCRKFANPDQPLQDLILGSEKMKGDDPDAMEQSNETINSPAFDDNWIELLTVHLSKEEASFLSHQIGARVKNSLIGKILLDAKVRTEFLDLPHDWNFTTFADEAPFLKQLPDSLQQIIVAARDFWQLMRGAHIRYNCLLQERRTTSELQEEFEANWDDWETELKSFPWERWETGFLWELAKLHRRRVGSKTRIFIEHWINELQSSTSVDKLDRLVTRQEYNNKGNRARLLPAAEMCSKWIGIKDLNYRLNVARTIINDIHIGLTTTEAEDA